LKESLIEYQKMPADNSGFVQAGGSVSYDSFVLSLSAVLRLNFCAKIPPPR
jgi:hypothetical protein